MAWLAGWNYRKVITISNGGSTLTDYQVLVTVDTLTLVTAGKLLSSCDDIRFTSSDGSTVLSYWIESGPNTTSTKIWVKIPSILSGSNAIYLYYNNAGASAASDGTNTFDFYEGFESYANGTAIPGTWNYFYEYYDATHYVTTTDKNTGTKSYYLGTYNNGQTADNWAFITLYSAQLTPREYLSLYSKGGSIAYGSTGAVILFIRASTSVTIGYRLRVHAATQNGLDSYCDYNTGIAQTNKVHQNRSNYEIYLDNVGTSWIKALDNRNIKTDYETNTGDSWSNVQKIVIYLTAGTAVQGPNGAAYAYYDDISLRKYVSPEPTFSISGTEELGITAYSMFLTPNETPCRTGICTVRADIVWQNLGSSSVTFRPKILIDGVTSIQAASDTTIVGAYPATSSSIQITTPTLSVGNHTICPDPN